MISVSIQLKEAAPGIRYFDLTQDAVDGTKALKALLNLHIHQDVPARQCFVVNTGPVNGSVMFVNAMTSTNACLKSNRRLLYKQFELLVEQWHQKQVHRYFAAII